MSRITFTDELGDTVDQGEVNNIFNDFTTYVNVTGIDHEIIQPKSIFYRHLLHAPIFLLAGRYVGIGDLGAYVSPGVGPFRLTPFLEMAAGVSSATFHFEVWYFSYDFQRDTYLNIGVYPGGGPWQQLAGPNHQRMFGWNKADQHNYKIYSTTQLHYYTRAPGWIPHEAGWPAPLICQATFGINSAFSSITYRRFGAYVYNPVAGSTIHDFDRCYMFLWAESNT